MRPPTADTSVDLRYAATELGLTDSRTPAFRFSFSVFDVHVNRAPIDGHVVRKIYVPGSTSTAALDKASENNEREAMVVRAASGLEVGVVRIAGLIARRIVTLAGRPSGRSGKPHRPYSVRQPR